MSIHRPQQVLSFTSPHFTIKGSGKRTAAAKAKIAVRIAQYYSLGKGKEALPMIMTPLSGTIGLLLFDERQQTDVAHAAKLYAWLPSRGANVVLLRSYYLVGGFSIVLRNTMC
ncbi:hypothetical protein [Paenibacillus contaminans]|uniref:hypothetical protein n=1 Tax=Paenibacillus contaminans TaxID=450362 RepID=UPI0011BFD8EC|nr:hypothetical protein [Paenibacillus contaminans]